MFVLPLFLGADSAEMFASGHRFTPFFYTIRSAFPVGARFKCGRRAKARTRLARLLPARRLDRNPTHGCRARSATTQPGESLERLEPELMWSFDLRFVIRLLALQKLWACRTPGGKLLLAGSVDSMQNAANLPLRVGDLHLKQPTSTLLPLF